MNLALAIIILLRATTAIGATTFMQHKSPVEMLWPIHGLYILTRWLAGLAVPAVFIYMTHDCIRRRATQSATGSSGPMPSARR